MIKTVITDYDFYNDRADEVEFNENISQILIDLKDTLLNSLGEVCLAAPQIGYKKRIVAMSFKDNIIRYFINPSISKTNGTMGFDIESCPSVPGTTFAVLRHPEIHLAYLNEDFKLAEHPMCMIGLSALQMQKAIDILDGRLICDGSLPILEGWDKLTPKQQDEIFKEWLQQQKETISKVKEEINADEGLKEMSNAIDFMQSVARGETILMTDEEIEKL